MRAVFGVMSLNALEPQHVYQYVDKRSQKKTSDTGKTTGGRVAAHREVEVLSHAFTKAVEWGYIRVHPFKKEVRLLGEAHRERYIEDWEVVEALSLPSVRKSGSVLAIQSYIRLKLLTGLRRSDLLRLQVSACREDGIHVRTNKTGKAVIYTWTPELRAAVEDAKAARPVHIAPFLFCDRNGQGYLDEETGRAPGGNPCGSGSWPVCFGKQRSLSTSPSTICGQSAQVMPNPSSTHARCWPMPTPKRPRRSTAEVQNE